MKNVKKFDLSLLVENTIKETDLAISVSEISDKIQKMIQDLSDTKIVDIAELVKQLKYDNKIEQAEQLEQNMGSKLDEAINTLTAIKSEIDNDVVAIFNGDSMGETPANEPTDMEADLGAELGDETAGEDDLSNDMDVAEPDDSVDDDLADLDNFGTVERTLK